jgi:hypothetical protein
MENTNFLIDILAGIGHSVKMGDWSIDIDIGIIKFGLAIILTRS